jgi:hypothetical protein
MSERLNKLRELVVKAALDHIAVEDFPTISEGFDPVDNEDALFDFIVDRDDSLIEVINYILQNGSFLRFELDLEQLDRFAPIGRMTD